MEPSKGTGFCLCLYVKGGLSKDLWQKCFVSSFANEAASSKALKSREQIYPVGHSFEAVCHIREEWKEVDEFYIYKMNDGRQNDGICYVFQEQQSRRQACN